VLILNERDLRHPAAGGAELHVFENFSRLASRGYDVSLACESFAGAPDEEEVQGIRVRRLGSLPAYYARAVALCRRETRDGHFDIVVECLNKLPFFAPLYSHAPVLALCHHLFGSTAFQQVPWSVAAAVWAAEKLIPSAYGRTPFITISDSSRDDLVLRGIDRARVQVSLCGIRQPGLAIHLDEPRRNLIVYLGRLAHYKRVDVMLRAAETLRARFPDLELAIIGRGPARAKLEALTRKLGLQGCTRFMGFVSDAERDALVAEARVCVCPSEKEGWGLTVIESNAVGTPVVAADAPGLRDSVRHEETGYLVEAGDVAGFAERIAALLESDELALRMSRAAYEWSQHFDWETSADGMAEAIDTARYSADDARQLR
jgi:glycosyltransferase involved in cell wall biosynthesis